jgi:hypothetical protein
MGRARIWIGVLAAGACAGCGDWQLRRHAAARTAEPERYAWQEEGDFPPPPSVPAEPASGTAVASTENAATVDFALETPTFTVEALPSTPRTAAAPAPAARDARSGRVQVFASRSLEAATTIRDDLAARFRQPVWLDYEPPYYKVRIGECGSDAACQELLAELRASGYAAAYVVPGVTPSP